MRVLLFLLPIVLGAAILFSISYWLSSREDSSAQGVVVGPRVSSTPEVKRELLAFLHGRSVLSACIEARTPINTQVFADTIERIKVRLAMWPGVTPELLDGAYAVEGCPGKSLDATPVSRWDLGRIVKTPSQFRLFIYVIPPEKFAQAFGDVPYAETNEEETCFGDSCVGVTTGLYLTSLDPDTLFEAVVDGLGLLQALYSPPSPISPVPSETPYQASPQPTGGSLPSPPATVVVGQ